MRKGGGREDEKERKEGRRSKRRKRKRRERKGEEEGEEDPACQRGTGMTEGWHMSSRDCVCVFRHTQLCSGLTPGPVLKDHS